MNPPREPPARLVVLGIDAASPDLLLRWAEDGSLPRLGALLERGLSGRTQGIEGFFVGSTWPSFATGCSPAGHGVHYLVQLIPGTYRYHRPHEGRYLHADPFWTRLSQAGKRVAILDVPLSRLDPTLNGIQVVEWGGHDALFGFGTSPSGLGPELVQRFGPHPVPSSCDADRRSPAEYAAFTDALVRGAELKGRLTRELLSRGGWDCLVQVFTEAHCAGHQCWHLHDPTHPAHDPATAAVVGDPLRRVYQAIDAAVGELLELAGETPVMVLSAHGMSYWYGAQFLLPDILHRLGAWYPAPAVEAPGDSPARAMAKRVWHGLPEALRGMLRPLRERLSPEARGGLPRLDLDAGRSRCFAVGNGLAVGAIRLNLRGREPQGMLTAGREAEEFSDWLSAALLEIVDARTGGPLVRRVLRTKDLYHGHCLEALPDLLVEWSDAVPTGSTEVAGGVAARVRAGSPRIGEVEGVNSYGRTGEHRPGGLFVAAGPGILPGRLERTVSLLDFAPTIGSLLGVPLPECEGEPIGELLRALR